MRIAHLVSTFPPQLGGMGSVCAQEAGGMAARGHDVTVFTMQYDERDYTEHDKQFSFKIVRLKPWLRYGDAGLIPQVVWRIRNFDMIHLHYPFFGGAEWLFFLRMPTVITWHMEAQLLGLKKLIGGIYNTVWPRLLLAKAKKIITVDIADFSRVKWSKIVAANKLIELNNGIDTHIFTPKPNSAQKEVKTILFVGNVLPVKRLDLLIQAMPLLGSANVRLIVVGNGPEMSRCRHLVHQLRLESKVVFAGMQASKESMAAYYANASCVVVPSDYESFSLVAIEAMACGVPMVLSSASGLSRRNAQAIFFEKGSAESLAQAIDKALSLSDQERKDIAYRQIDEVRSKYSLERHLDALEKIYASVLVK
jgi:glycosyltransferase involved in cell wall biosynthesis